jgi:hypothetical protein
MGNFLGKKEKQLEIYKVNFPHSNKYRLSCWETYDTSKNFDYYFSDKRCTKISRGLYVNDFDKGYLYGRYTKINPIDKIDGQTTETENKEIFQSF